MTVRSLSPSEPWNPQQDPAQIPLLCRLYLILRIQPNLPSQTILYVSPTFLDNAPAIPIEHG